MYTKDQPIDNLREGLRVSPDNVSIHHFADLLLSRGWPDEAAAEYREALRRSPRNPDIRVGLARICYQRRNKSETKAIVIDLLNRSDPPARVYLLHALLCDEIGRKEEEFRKAIQADPSIADDPLAKGLVELFGTEASEPREGVDSILRVGYSFGALGQHALPAVGRAACPRPPSAVSPLEYRSAGQACR